MNKPETDWEVAARTIRDAWEEAFRPAVEYLQKTARKIVADIHGATTKAAREETDN